MSEQQWLVKMSLAIEFTSPDARILGKERKSKLLRPGSSLHEWILAARTALQRRGVVFDARPPHIEILAQHEADDEAKARLRTRLLHGKTVPNPPRMYLLGKALVVETPALDNGQRTHATIAYFPGGLTDAQAYAHMATITSSLREDVAVDIV